MGVKIERLGGAHTMQGISDHCSNCTTEAKCRRRDFSEQAWTVLLLWNEVQASAVDQPLCDDCYKELRETLIDRAEEVSVALTEGSPAGKRDTASRKTPGGRTPRVRKAG